MQTARPSREAFWLGPVHRSDDERIREVVSCPDNQFIPRVDLAGQIVDGTQIMHNGLRASLWEGGYYGNLIIRMLEANRGVHEPQEERAFQEVLRFMPPRATMLELGAYWSFYSMWFHKNVPDAQCFMIEPNKNALQLGMINFQLNNMNGKFYHGGVGGKRGELEDGTPVYTVPDIVNGSGINFLNVLHSDIEGYEFEMLEGAKELFDQRRVGHVFVSTHSNELHEKCKAFLEAQGFMILASADCYESYEYEGILVGRLPDVPGPDTISISKRGEV